MVAIAEDKFLLYQLSAGSTQVTGLCRRGIIPISLQWRCDKTEKKRFVRILTDVISFRDSAGLKQGNKDRPVSVLRKSAGFGP